MESFHAYLIGKKENSSYQYLLGRFSWGQSPMRPCFPLTDHLCLKLIIYANHLYLGRQWTEMLNYFVHKFTDYSTKANDVTITNDNLRGNIFWFSQSVASRGETLSLVLFLFVACITQISTLWLFIGSRRSRRKN